MYILTYCFLKNFKKITLVWVLSVPAWAAANQSDTVVTSIKPLALITQEIIRETDLKVDALLPPNVSEHNYALKISDIQRLRSARLVIWLSPEADPYLASSESIWLQADQGWKSLPLLAQMDLEPGSVNMDVDEADAGHHHPGIDPHVWLNPMLARQIAKQITQRLGLVDPLNKALFEKNLQRFEQEVNALDKQTFISLGGYKQSPFIVYHQAYGYFVRHYQLNQIAALHSLPGADMSLQQVGQIQQKISQQTQSICIFHEPQFTSARLPAFTSNRAIKTGVLDPLGINASTYYALIENLTEGFVGCFGQK